MRKLCLGIFAFLALTESLPARGEAWYLEAGAGLAWFKAVAGEGAAVFRPAVGLGCRAYVTPYLDLRTSARWEHLGVETETELFGLTGNVRVPYLSVSPMARWYLNRGEWSFFADTGLYGAVALSRHIRLLGSLIEVDLKDRLTGLDFGAETGVGVRYGTRTALEFSLRGKFGLINLSRRAGESARNRFLFLLLAVDHQF